MFGNRVPMPPPIPQPHEGLDEYHARLTSWRNEESRYAASEAAQFAAFGGLLVLFTAGLFGFVLWAVL